DIYSNDIRIVIKDFRKALLKNIEKNVLTKFCLAISATRADQVSKIFLPAKRTMVTLNIPRQHGSDLNYRRTGASELLRSAIVDAMVATAQELMIQFVVLGTEYCAT
ncbi:MAG: hypothetical protein ACHQF3_14740, partial [Alphaproteobacteria bacterium]